MENHELAEINASLQAIVRRAYDLGRTEALKRVVDVLSAERPSADQLVLMAPDDQPEEVEEQVHPHAMNGQAQGAAKPWWAWPVR